MSKIYKKLSVIILGVIAYAPVAYAITYQEFIQNFIVGRILRPIANLMFLLATVIFIWGIVGYIANADNEKSRTEGRDHMIWGIVGLVIMSTVYIILSILSSFFYPAGI